MAKDNSPDAKMHRKDVGLVAAGVYFLFLVGFIIFFASRGEVPAGVSFWVAFAHPAFIALVVLTVLWSVIYWYSAFTDKQWVQDGGHWGSVLHFVLLFMVLAFPANYKMNGRSDPNTNAVVNKYLSAHGKPPITRQ